ncbi:MmcQ/YjbR family DNA-binding protein [Sphingobium mellinum]
MSDFRTRALALPGAIEQPHHGSPSFRVGGKIFAQLSSDGLTALLKLPLSLQEWGRATFPDACLPEPGRWGETGWTRLLWTDLPDSSLTEMIEASWTAVATANFKNRKDG